MQHKITAVLATVALSGSLFVGGAVLGSTPAAVADSRCTTVSHKHAGTLWWTITHEYLGRTKNTVLKVWMHQHTDSAPKACAKY